MPLQRNTTRWNCALFAALAFMTAAASGQSGNKNSEWPTYGADLAGSKYRPLDQINASNFGKLEVAWRFKTNSLGNRPEYKLEGTPLMVNGILFATAGSRRAAIALDGPQASCCGSTASTKARVARLLRGKCRAGGWRTGATARKNEFYISRQGSGWSA